MAFLMRSPKPLLAANCLLLSVALTFSTSNQMMRTFDKELNEQEQWLSDKVNTGREPVFCSDSSLRSPIDVQGSIIYKNFKLEEHFDYSDSTYVTKISDHIYKVEGKFGFLGFEQTRYDILYAMFKAPSEHLIEGERLPLELQIVTKNLHGDHLTLSVLFKVGSEPNFLLSILGFGKGILNRLSTRDYLKPAIYNISEAAVTLKPFLLNNGSWVMYQGSGLSPPCANTTWLISLSPASLSEHQLQDFSLTARPDFTMKTIGNRQIYRNELTDSDPNMKQIRATQERENQIMKERILKKQAEKAEKQMKKEQEKKIKNEKLKAAILDYRNHKFQKDFENPPEVGEEPMITEGLLFDYMREIEDFNFMHTPCKDYVQYLPPLDQTYGFIPADGIMIWELKSFLVTHKNITIPQVELPKPVNTSYIYRPLYYIPKPDCHQKNKLPSVKSLARSKSNLSVGTGNSSEYVPVVVETDPSFVNPERPTSAYLMAVPGRSPELQYIPLQRNFIFDISKFPEQNLTLAQLHNQTWGHIVTKPEFRPFSPVPELTSPTDSRGRVIRIWPKLNTTRDGIVPDDAVYAWQGIKESQDIVSNVSFPRSFNSEYRWIVFMYLRSNYSVGESNSQPLVPVFILARNEFNFSLGMIPESIPVPRNTELIDGSIKAELITIAFSPEKTDQLISDPNILKKPIGYDSEKIYEKIDSFRRKMFIRRADLDPLYFNQTQEKYQALLRSPEGGRPDDLRKFQLEQTTGIIVLPDPDYRKQLEDTLRRKELELLQRLKKEADRKKRMEAIWSEPERVVRYQKVCKEWRMMVILNDRINFAGKDKETKDMKVCIDWEWRVITDKNDLYKPERPEDGKQPNKNPNNSTSNSSSAIEQKQKEIKEKIIKEIEDYCMEKVHVILNDWKKEAQDKHYELCKSTLDKLRKTDVSLFMRSLNPALKSLKIIAEKSSIAAQAATSLVNNEGKKVADYVKDGLDKSKYMSPNDFQTVPPELAQTSLHSKKKIVLNTGGSKGFLKRLEAKARKLWSF